MPTLPSLQVSRTEADALIGEQIKIGRRTTVQLHEFDGGTEAAEARYVEWDSENIQLLLDIFDIEKLANEYQSIASNLKVEGNYKDYYRNTNHERRVNAKIEWLKELQRRLAHFPEPITLVPAFKLTSTVDTLHLICSRFHAVVRQLRQRYDGRSTLEVNDEYDVQDLLHALLKMYFGDIRREDPSPKRAGASSRTDFVLKNEEVIFETKMTRATLKEKQLGEELIIDIERYRSHPNCKLLYCFVYDPDGYIANPTGLENDLSRTEGSLTVQVHVAPKQ